MCARARAHAILSKESEGRPHILARCELLWNEHSALSQCPLVLQARPQMLRHLRHHSARGCNRDGRSRETRVASAEHDGCMPVASDTACTHAASASDLHAMVQCALHQVKEHTYARRQSEKAAHVESSSSGQAEVLAEGVQHSVASLFHHLEGCLAPASADHRPECSFL